MLHNSSRVAKGLKESYQFPTSLMFLFVFRIAPTILRQFVIYNDRCVIPVDLNTFQYGNLQFNEPKKIAHELSLKVYVFRL